MWCYRRIVCPVVVASLAASFALGLLPSCSSSRRPVVTGESYVIPLSTFDTIAPALIYQAKRKLETAEFYASDFRTPRNRDLFDNLSSIPSGQVMLDNISSATRDIVSRHSDEIAHAFVSAISGFSQKDLVASHKSEQVITDYIALHCSANIRSTVASVVGAEVGPFSQAWGVLNSGYEALKVNMDNLKKVGEVSLLPKVEREDALSVLVGTIVRKWFGEMIVLERQQNTD